MAYLSPEATKEAKVVAIYYSPVNKDPLWPIQVLSGTLYNEDASKLLTRLSLRGQSVSEYGIGIALIALLCIAAATLMGANIQNTVSWMAGEIGQKPIITSSAVNMNEPQIKDAAQLALEDGTTIELGNYASNLSQAIETSGANGTTELLTQQLLKQIAHMKEKGEITPVQEEALMALAKQGTRMAAIEKVLEDAAKAHTSGNMDQVMVQFEGKSYEFGILRRELGWKQSEDLSSYLLTQPNAAPGTQHLIDLYHNAVYTGALKNEESFAKVSALVNEIAYLSEVVDDGTWAVGEGGTQQPQNLNNFMVSRAQAKAIQTSKISDTTRDDSDGICTGNTGCR